MKQNVKWLANEKLGHMARLYFTFEFDVWVPGLRIDPLHLLAGCRKR